VRKLEVEYKLGIRSVTLRGEQGTGRIYDATVRCA